MLGNCLDTLSWCWYTKIKKAYLVSLSIIFTTLSVVVLLGEISIFTHVDLNVFGHLLKDDFGFVRVQVAFYIIIFRLWLSSHWSIYLSVPTMDYSISDWLDCMGSTKTITQILLVYYSVRCIRLYQSWSNFSSVSFPLAYNFLQMMSIKEKTPFTLVIGDMDFVPVFGSSFSLSKSKINIISSSHIVDTCVGVQLFWNIW